MRPEGERAHCPPPLYPIATSSLSRKEGGEGEEDEKKWEGESASERERRNISSTPWHPHFLLLHHSARSVQAGYRKKEGKSGRARHDAYITMPIGSASILTQYILSFTTLIYEGLLQNNKSSFLKKVTCANVYSTISSDVCCILNQERFA